MNDETTPREEANLSALRCAAVLASLLHLNAIPAAHRKHAEEIVAEWKDAQRKWYASLGIEYIDLTPARKNFSVGDRVRYSDAYKSRYGLNDVAIGTVRAVESNGNSIAVRWDCGASSPSIDPSNLTSEAA